MQRASKVRGISDSATSVRVGQDRFPGRAAHTDDAFGIDDSPFMVAQRMKLQGMFGSAAQLKAEEEEELLQGKSAPKDAARLKEASAVPVSGSGTVQRRRAIDARQRQIDRLQDALDQIPEGGQNATRQEIMLHDNAIGAGQHHRNRVVGRNALRADLQDRIDTLTGYQDRDNGQLPDLRGRQAAQLQGENSGA